MKTAEYNAKGRFLYTEDNPNPRFRPSVSALAHKLRTMKALQSPEAVAYIADDLIHYHLLREAKHPDLLWRLMGSLQYYWKASVGLTEARQLEWVENAVTGDDASEKVSLPMDHEWVPLVQGGQVTSIDLVAGAEKPLAEPFEASVEQKVQISALIREHAYNFGEKECYCGKAFKEPSAFQRWSMHLRNRILEELYAWNLSQPAPDHDAKASGQADSTDRAESS